MDPEAPRAGIATDGQDSGAGEIAPILKADPAMRRRTLAWIVVLVVALGLTLFAVTRWIARVQAISAVDAKTAAHDLVWLTWCVAAVAALMALGMAAVLSRLSIKVRRAAQYPLPGARVLRDTPIRTGERAQRMAAVSVVLAVLLAIAAVAIVATAWSLWRLLVR
jgi:ABC-type anion transport system duplicated permease subunit